MLFRLSLEEVEASSASARAAAATPYTVLLSAFVALLHAASGQHDLVVGTPVHGRNQPETERLIGFFVNTLALRFRLAPRLPFPQLLEGVRRNVFKALRHREAPLEALLHELRVPRDLSRTPLYQAFFSYQDVSARPNLFCGLPSERIELVGGSTPTEVAMWLRQERDGIAGRLQYSTDLFDAATVERLVERYREILRAAVREDRKPVDGLAAAEGAQPIRSRIDLGEIERVLGVHPAVLRCAAATHELRPGDVRPVVYLVVRPGQAWTPTELRKHLQDRLPDQPLAQHFVELEALPLAPDGQIDRSALRLPAQVRASAPVREAPATEAERSVAQVWRQLLGVANVGRRDNFFELGGHSLLCMQALELIRERTGARLSARAMLLDTLEQLAARVPEPEDWPRPTAAAAPTLARRVLRFLRRIWRGTGRDRDPRPPPPP